MKLSEYVAQAALESGTDHQADLMDRLFALDIPEQFEQDASSCPAADAILREGMARQGGDYYVAADGYVMEGSEPDCRWGWATGSGDDEEDVAEGLADIRAHLAGSDDPALVIYMAVPEGSGWWRARIGEECAI